MAKGRPYADPRSGPRYLPGYERQVVGAAGTGGSIVPIMDGYRYATKRKGEQWRDVELFTNALTDVSKAYYAAMEARDIRDTSVMIDETLRQRRLEVFSTATGKAADNLLASEDEWQKKTRDEIIKKSGLGSGIAKTLWDKKAQSYLDSVTGHMIQQHAIAEKNSKAAFVINAQNELALAGVGDFKAYAQYSALVNDTYGEGTVEALKAKEQGIDVVIDSWTAQNPGATLQWFNRNKEGLRQVLGREFSDVARAMERTENKLESRMRRAEMQAARNDRLAEKAQKKKDKEWLDEFLTDMIAEDPEKPVDINEQIKAGLDSGISGETLLKAQGAFEKQEKADLKKQSAQVSANFFATAVVEGLSGEEESNLNSALAAGTITAQDYNAVKRADKATKAAENTGLKEHRKIAVAQLKNAFAPRGAFDPVNQASEYKYQQAVSQLTAYADQCKTLEEKRRAYDILDKNSYVSQLIRANTAGLTPQHRMQKAYSMEPFDPDSRITLPDNQQRKPGESLSDWKKRTGN